MPNLRKEGRRRALPALFVSGPARIARRVVARRSPCAPRPARLPGPGPTAGRPGGSGTAAGARPGTRPARSSVTARRSARRRMVRASSSAALVRVSPGTTNSVGKLDPRLVVGQDRVDPGDHLRRDPRVAVAEAVPGGRVRGQLRARRRRARAGSAGRGPRSRPSAGGRTSSRRFGVELGPGEPQGRDRLVERCRRPRSGGRPWGSGRRRRGGRSCRRRRGRWRRPRRGAGCAEARAPARTRPGRRSSLTT